MHWRPKPTRRVIDSKGNGSGSASGRTNSVSAGFVGRKAALGSPGTSVFGDCGEGTRDDGDGDHGSAGAGVAFEETEAWEEDEVAHCNV